MKSPVCLIIFRRPAHTRRVLQAIAGAHPEKLMIFADGPRPGMPEDLGCGLGPAMAISWAFQQVNEAIILEDDCVPHPSFFGFCDELLEKYRHDQRIMHINGCTYKHGTVRIPESYYFCQDIGCWGWATWKRAWNCFDIGVKQWATLRNTTFLRDVIDSDRFVDHYRQALETAFQSSGNVNYWDYQWAFACWVNGGLGIYPRHNLVRNEGCGPEATHTFDSNTSVANMQTHKMLLPLTHPAMVFPNRGMDRQGWDNHLPRVEDETPTRRIRRHVLSLTPGFLKKIARHCRASYR